MINSGWFVSNMWNIEKENSFKFNEFSNYIKDLCTWLRECVIADYYIFSHEEFNSLLRMRMYSKIQFKYEHDMLMFRLKFSEFL
jgi:hypothetical protein